jgi:hypothetical protein
MQLRLAQDLGLHRTHYIHNEPQHIKMRRTYSHTGKIAATVFEDNASLYLGAPVKVPYYFSYDVCITRHRSAKDKLLNTEYK